ncbi:MAG: hypothetical protein ABW352_13385 [Polyangiales bacterium]
MHFSSLFVRASALLLALLWLGACEAAPTTIERDAEAPDDTEQGQRVDAAVDTAARLDARVHEPVARPSVDAAPSDEGPSWHRDVAPLLAERCGACHQEGGVAPFSVATYEGAKPFAKTMASAVERGTMPPFLAQEGPACETALPWARDPRLSREEQALLRTWAEHGAPEGEASGAVPGLPTPGGLAREDLAVTLPREVVVEGSDDMHLCMVLDPRLDQDRYVLGTLTTPGNRKVVHHAKTMMLKPTSTAGLFGIGATPLAKPDFIAQVEQYTGARLGEIYECKTGEKLAAVPQEVLDVWAPGGGPRMAPNNAATFMPRDSLVLLNVHYHPIAQREVDATTSVRFQFADAKPSHVAQMVEIGGFQTDSPLAQGRLVAQPGELSAAFKVPAGASAHVEEMQFTWTAGNVRVYSLFPHMHYVGSDMHVSLQRLAGEQCLIHTPRWDFNWQLVYDYAGSLEQLPELRTTDVIRVRCTYDNSMGNAALRRELDLRGLDAPEDVFYGEDSNKEMCIAFLGVTYPNFR